MKVLKGSHRLGRINHNISGQLMQADSVHLEAAFQNFPLSIELIFKIHPFLLSQNSKITPFYWVKIQNFPLFIGSIFCKRSSLRSLTFLSFRTLHLAYHKLVGTPCRTILYEKWARNKKPWTKLFWQQSINPLEKTQVKLLKILLLQTLVF